MKEHSEQQTVEEFCAAMRELTKIWPIWGFRCSGKPYITNKAEISREVKRREAQVKGAG